MKIPREISTIGIDEMEATQQQQQIMYIERIESLHSETASKDGKKTGKFNRKWFVNNPKKK